MGESESRCFFDVRGWKSVERYVFISYAAMAKVVQELEERKIISVEKKEAKETVFLNWRLFLF